MQSLVLITIFMSYVIGNADDLGSNNPLELMQDMSESCIDNMQLNVFLPYGMGVADAVVMLLSSKEKHPNCIISFNRLETKSDLFVIVVMEFSDSREINSNACEHLETEIIITDELQAKVDVCDQIRKNDTSKSIYYGTSKSSNVSLQFKSTDLLPTIKLTATAARTPPMDLHCNFESEIPCLIGNMTLCISIELLCDQNINCGVIGSNDEDVRICERRRYYKLWIVVSCTLLMLIIVSAFLINLFKMYVPAVPDNFFIFNEDEDNKLILASKYIAPQKTGSHHNLRHADLQSFKLRNFPLDAHFPSTSSREPEHQPRTSFSPEKSATKTQDEIDLELLKEELRKEIEKEISRAIMQEYRPRFESDFITIMDHIDSPGKSDGGQDKS